jgi:hypothetical protein
LPYFDVSLDLFLELVHVLLELGGQCRLQPQPRRDREISRSGAGARLPTPTRGRDHR